MSIVRLKPKHRRKAISKTRLIERFVQEHKLTCMICKQPPQRFLRWARKGVSANGPWAICEYCDKRTT